MSQIHPQARTTPRTRAEIKAATGTLQEVAERYNISVPTARKWKRRDEVQDRSHRPHRLSTTMPKLIRAPICSTMFRPLIHVLRQGGDCGVCRASIHLL
jgi:hypothetical protein